MRPERSDDIEAELEVIPPRGRNPRRRQRTVELAEDPAEEPERPPKPFDIAATCIGGAMVIGAIGGLAGPLWALLAAGLALVVIGMVVI